MHILMGKVIYREIINAPLDENSGVIFPIPIVKDFIKTYNFNVSYRNKIFKTGVRLMGAYEGKLIKRSVERFKVNVDFSNDLYSDEKITQVSVIATDLASGSVATIIGVTGITDKSIYYGLKGGVSGHDYRIKIQVITNQRVSSTEGGLREVLHLVQVRD